MTRSMAAVLIVFVTGFITSQAMSAVILNSQGTNSILEAKKGKFFIPEQLSTSGDLGDPLTGKKRVGLQSDKVRLKLTGPATSTGHVNIDEAFALSEPMDIDTARLALTFKDLDLLTQQLSGGTLAESLTITYHPIEGDDITLTLDSANYTSFRTDGGTATNNTFVTYYIDLAADLGLSQADIDDINANLSLPLSLDFTSTLTRAKKGSKTYTNTAETFSAILQYQPDQGSPEPMTMALLLAGLPLMMRRNRK